MTTSEETPANLFEGVNEGSDDAWLAALEAEAVMA